jgi:hypothetical protein
MADHKLMRAASNGDVELAREALREGANTECQALSPKPVRPLRQRACGLEGH